MFILQNYITWLFKWMSENAVIKYMWVWITVLFVSDNLTVNVITCYVSNFLGIYIRDFQIPASYSVTKLVRM